MSAHLSSNASSETAIFYSSGSPIKVRSLPIPSLQPQEILIRNEFTTLCRSDLHTYSGKRQEKSPTILGHEIVGRIEQFGSEAPQTDLRGTPLQIGDRVSWAIYASDPCCDMAQKGIPQKGEQLFKYGHEQLSKEQSLHGGLSQYTILREHTPILKIDESVSLSVAATVNCAVSTIAGALRLAGEVRNKAVLVSGAGMMGMIASAMCKSAGASLVATTDINPQRLNQANAFGADEAMLASSMSPPLLTDTFGSDRPFDLVLELSGAPTAMEHTLDYLKTGGVAVWVGATFPLRDIRVNAEQVIRRLLTIKGLHNYNQSDFLRAVDFIEQHHSTYPFASLISKTLFSG